MFIGCLIAILLTVIVLGVSWIMTCGIVWLITLCFGWTFSWAIATGIWLVLSLIGAVIKK